MSWHCLGPGDMPVEAQRRRHIAVAILMIAVGGLVTVSLRIVREPLSQISRTGTSSTTVSASRSISFGLADISVNSAPEQRLDEDAARQALHHQSCPASNILSTASRISGTLASTSPSLLLAHAAYRWAIGNSDR